MGRRAQRRYAWAVGKRISSDSMRPKDYQYVDLLMKAFADMNQFARQLATAYLEVGKALTPVVEAARDALVKLESTQSPASG